MYLLANTLHLSPYVTGMLMLQIALSFSVFLALLRIEPLEDEEHDCSLRVYVDFESFERMLEVFLKRLRSPE